MEYWRSISGRKRFPSGLRVVCKPGALIHVCRPPLVVNFSGSCVQFDPFSQTNHTSVVDFSRTNAIKVSGGYSGQNSHALEHRNFKIGLQETERRRRILSVRKYANPCSAIWRKQGLLRHNHKRANQSQKDSRPRFDNSTIFLGTSRQARTRDISAPKIVAHRG